MTAPGMVASTINETNEMSSVKSFTMAIGMISPPGSETL